MKRRYKLVAVCMAAFLLFSGSVLPAAAVSQSELESQLAEFKRQEAQIAGQLLSAKSDLNASQQRKNLIDSQIANAKKQIDLLDSQVEAKNNEITAITQKIAEDEQAIADKKAAIADTQAKLGERMRAITKRGTKSTLQLLIDTDNYTDYLIKSKAAQLIAQQDQAAIRAYEAEMVVLAAEQEELAQKRTTLEAEISSLDSKRAESTAKKKELDTLYAAAQSEVRKMQSTVSGYNSQLNAKKAEMERIEQDIQNIILGSGSSGSYNGKMMYWPVPTVRAVSSDWGERWGTMHRGIDIANGPVPIYGQNIVAAASGTVIYSNYDDSWGGGFGNWCLIDHGRDAQGRQVTTLYAHCSKMFARVGQKVVGGKTVIGQAGASGDVTGPHLHFEVRLNGKSVKPMPTYVSPYVN